jgi:hypothetical protein
MVNTATRFRIFLTIACIFSGLLAGGDIYRYLIEVPAWRHLDMISWREYSRHADLGNGIFLFPFEAVVAAAMLLMASISVLKSKSPFKTIALPVHLATIFSLAGLALTFLAAPIMLRLRTIGNDPEMIRQTFDNFHFWGLLRCVAQVLSFFACVWAAGKVFSTRNHNLPGPGNSENKTEW